MIPLLEQHMNAIHAACRRHGVAKLAVFGSALDPASFDSRRSDVDFVVTFHRGTDLGPWLGEYFDLRADLQSVLGYPVDLVMEGASHELVFNDEPPRVIYAAADTEAA
jgi:predicted nucleotidyltransferase